MFFAVMSLSAKNFPATARKDALSSPGELMVSSNRFNSSAWSCHICSFRLSGVVGSSFILVTHGGTLVDVEWCVGVSGHGFSSVIVQPNPSANYDNVKTQWKSIK